MMVLYKASFPFVAIQILLIDGQVDALGSTDERVDVRAKRRCDVPGDKTWL